MDTLSASTPSMDTRITLDPRLKWPHVDTWQGRPAAASMVAYWRPKPKLHGTYGAVRVSTERNVVAYSRKWALTLDADNHGFAAWVESTGSFWQNAGTPLTDVVIHGEWAGPGIHAGHDAVQLLPDLHFFVFAVSMVQDDGTRWVVGPNEIKKRLDAVPGGIPDRVHVLPWVENIGTHNPSADARELTAMTKAWGQHDRYMAEAFNIEAPGEGFVFYPHPFIPVGMFKAKAPAHTQRSGEDAVRSHRSPPAANVVAFVEKFVTPARLQQHCDALPRPLGPASIGPFIGAVAQDVAREAAEDLGDLSWKDVQRAIAASARDWFLDVLRQLEQTP